MNADIKHKSEVSVVLAFFAALALIGIAGAGFIVDDYAKARASTAWSIVEGVVLSNRPGEGPGPRYVYSVGGRSYEAVRRRFFVARFSGSPLQVLQPGEAIPVYVSPKDASVSVLQPGGAGAVFVLFSIISGLCVFTGVGGIIRTLIETARESASTDDRVEFQTAE